MFSPYAGDSPPPVYTVSPPAYVASPDYINTETGDSTHLPAPNPGSPSQPPSYQQLFPSSTLGANLPPIEILPIHPLQPPPIQQLVPYG